MARKRKTQKRDDRRDYREKDRNYDERRGSRDKAEYKDSATNDISWYSKNPNLLIAAGSFPYPYRPGMQLPLGDANVTDGTANVLKSRSLQIPGVLVLDWIPNVGYSQYATDPASIMGKELYSRVRQAYSGDLAADAPDFVIYLMALDSMYSYLAWLKRLYRVMNAWTPENYVLPDVVLSAMGLTDADLISLRSQRMQLWQIINELILQSRKFTCPAVMDIFNRHYWMSDNVYTDEAAINSQFYMFNLKAVYQFSMLEMADGNEGPGLAMTPLPTEGRKNNTPLNPTDFYTFGRNLIDALVAWDGAYTINGYLQRAYDGNPNFIVDELPADQPFNPVYVPEVLAQIENSRVVPAGDTITDFSTFNVIQNVETNAVVSAPHYTLSATNAMITAQAYTIPPVLSVRSVTPTVADSTIASRLQAAVEVSEPVSGKVTLSVIAATEIPLSWRLVTEVNTIAAFYAGKVVNQTPAMIFTPSTTLQNALLSFNSLMQIFDLEQFDWHPFVYITKTISGQIGGVTYDAIAQLAVAGDTHNITTITIEDLKNLHKICVYSELNSFML